MSIKNVALDTKVYDRLARFKQESESFSKAIDRMLSHLDNTHTGEDVLRQLSILPELSESDSRTILNTVREDRATEKWDRHDLP